MTPEEYFTQYATDIIRDLEAKGVLTLHANATSNTKLDIDSPKGQDLIKTVALSVYNGTVQYLNTHRAPEL